MKKRIYAFDGLKGIACISVCIHHFLLMFLPATYFGIGVIQHTQYSFEYGASQSPLAVIINGNFAVTLYLMITGYLVYYKCSKINKKDLWNQLPILVIKRYLRIVLPVFIISIIVLIVMKLSYFDNKKVIEMTNSPWATMMYNEVLGLKDAIVTSFIKVPFLGNDQFSTAFWMLKYTVLGSFFAMLLAYSKKIFNKYMSIILLMVCVILSFSETYYFIIALGVLLADISDMKITMGIKRKIVAIFFVLIGLFLGGYPTYGDPTNIYNFLDVEYYGAFLPVIYHSVGAFLLIWGVSKIEIVNKFCRCSIIKFLSKISFSVYLVHIPILFSISPKLFSYYYKITQFRYTLATGITLLMTMLIVIFVATIFHYLIEDKINKKINTMNKLNFRKKDREVIK